MAYCGPRAVPYSKFLAWDPLDQALALAWQAREASKCPQCRIPWGDWYLDDGTPDDSAYDAELYRCPGCERLASVEIDKNDKGVMKRLVPRWSARRWRNFGRG